MNFIILILANITALIILTSLWDVNLGKIGFGRYLCGGIVAFAMFPIVYNAILY